jgi:hypothetical protein
LGGIGSNSVEKKISFFLKGFYFQPVLRIERTFDCQVVPRPGKKAFPGFRGTEKGGASSFLNAGFRRFRAAIPRPPRLFAETKRGGLGRSLPALSGFGACFFAWATRRAVQTTSQLGEDSIFDVPGKSPGPPFCGNSVVGALPALRVLGGYVF